MLCCPAADVHPTQFASGTAGSRLLSTCPVTALPLPGGPTWNKTCTHLWEAPLLFGPHADTILQGTQQLLTRNLQNRSVSQGPGVIDAAGWLSAAQQKLTRGQQLGTTHKCTTTASLCLQLARGKPVQARYLPRGGGFRVRVQGLT